MAVGEKSKGILTRAQMVKNIRERLKEEKGITLTKEQISAVLSIQDDEIYMCIAKCLEYRTLWGTIMGVIRPPRRVGGTFREVEVVRKRHGWSNYKFGVPKVKWSQACKVCENHPASEYFELDEHRYTTLAREFRKECGLPEIPEYQDLDEEKVKSLCKKADEIELSKLTAQERYNKIRDDKHNAEKRKAYRTQWEKTGHIPVGVVYSEALGEDNYTGKQYDTVDYFLNNKLKEEEKLTAAQLYNYVLNAKELALRKGYVHKHPEIDELLVKYKDEMDKQKLEELPYESCYYSRKDFTLKYNGEVNPWGITFEDEDNYDIPLEILKTIGYTDEQFAEYVEKIKNSEEEKLKGEEQVETE